MKKTKSTKNDAIRLAVLALLAVGVYAILPQLKTFDGSLDILKRADLLLVALAFLASVFTYFFAALVYRSLALKPLKLGRTFLMQVSAMFINRIFPAGIGALGMNAAYLHKEKHTLTQAGIIVGLNNLLGMAGHAMLLALIYVFFAPSLDFEWNYQAPKRILIGVLVTLVVMAILASLIFKKKIRSMFTNFKKQLQLIAKTYKRSPMKIVLALLSAIGITLSFTICLWLSLEGVGINVDLPTALILLTFGVGAGTAIPLPGGIGGVEGGIYAGLIALKTDPKEALAGILLFRLVSYWMPLFIGFFVFVYTKNRGWFTFVSARNG